MNFNDSETKQNLARAFAAECQAGARYQFMATQAQNEQLVFIKDTLKMLAKNEMAHAKLFYDYILDKSGGDCEVGICADYPYVEPSLADSLKAEVEIELDEFENLYPSFAKVALSEGFEDIANSFMVVSKVEQTHAEMLRMLAKNYAKNKLYSHKQKVLMKCSNCGHVAIQTSGWKECPLCNLGTGNIEIDFKQVLLDCLNA